MPLAFEQ